MKDYHKILFPYAYNILGSSEDAKDAIQDVLSSYLSAKKEGIQNEKSYLIKAVINQSINMKNRRKKISYEDVWLPEPVATEAADTNINMRDIASYSLLILLEKLNPKERAVFILKEAFGYSHEEISEVLSATVENSRKLLSRAKMKLDPAKHPVVVPEREIVPSGVLDKYIGALRGGDVKTLEELLSRDIVFYADGGEKLNVVRKVCTGRHDVTELLVYVYEKYDKGLSSVPARINHQPALLYYRGEELVACQVFGLSADGSHIVQISNVIDPEKLRNLRVA